MKKIKGSKFKNLIKKSKILEQDEYGEKVLLTPENMIVKIFRRKRLLSSALFVPYSKRFIKNIGKLEKLGFTVPVITDILFCKEFKRHLVYYIPLPGETLRDTFVDNHDQSLIIKLAEFIALLHNKGVYFRSLHFGNIILMPGGNFGLIDVSDTKFYPFKKQLGVKKRIRNFRHIARYKEDMYIISEFGIDRFIDKYLDSTIFKDKSGTKLRKGVKLHFLTGAI